MSGQVKIFRSSSLGKEQILEVLNPGDTCACNPGTENWSCSSSAQALTPCRVWFLSRREYTQLVKTNHKLSHHLSRIFAERLCRFCSLIEDISVDDPDKKLAKFILDMCESQTSTSTEDGYLCLLFTHEDISQRLGLVRETVTRHLSKLKRLHLIDTKPSRILVLNKAGLQKISCP